MTTSTAALPYEIFTLRDFRLQSGGTLPEARLAYQTYGAMNADRSNVILYPTSYAALHTDIDWLVGPGKILDTTKYFVIIPNMFGNGYSSSPSNLPIPSDGAPPPRFSHDDDIAAQHRLLTDVFGIERLALVYGWSMGGQQALLWGALYPEMVARIAALCTSAKTSPHNIVFLESLRAILRAAPEWDGARFTAKPEKALKAFGRVYAGWALSQAWYRVKTYESLGYHSLEEYLVGDWEASFLRRDAGNLLSMLDTWIHSDISDNETYCGDLQAALSGIRAPTYVMPGSCDLYFTAHDALAEARQIPNAHFRPIPSIWGHRAGNPAKHRTDELFIQAAVNELLNDEPFERAARQQGFD